MTNLSFKLAATLLCLVPLAACSHDDAAQAADSAKKAAAATGDKLTEMKNDFVAATKKEMDEVGVQYDELKKKAANASDDAKAGMQKTLDDIKAKKDELVRDWDASKAAHDGSSFETAKAKFEDGMKDLKKRISDALDKNK